MGERTFQDIVRDVESRTKRRERRTFQEIAQSQKVPPQERPGPRERRAVSPRLLRFGHQQQKRVRRKEIEAERAGVSLPKKAWSGFWEVLDVLDRPRNALHNAILHLRNGDRYGVGGVFESLKKGITAEERTYFEDIIETFATPTQEALAWPLLKAGMDLRTARKVMGFGGDMLIAPENVMMMGTLLAKGARAAGASRGLVKTLEVIGAPDKELMAVIGKPVRAGLRKVPIVKDIMERTFLRSTGIPEIDALRNEQIDHELAMRSGLYDDAKDLAEFLTPLREKHSGLVMRLAEERELLPAFRFAKDARSSKLTLNQIENLIADRGFKNPKAVKELVGITDNDTFMRVLQGTHRSRQFFRKLKNLRQLSGQNVPGLGTQLARDIKAINIKITRLMRDIQKKEQARIKSHVKVLKAKADARGKTMKELLGPKRFHELQRRMHVLGRSELPSIADSAGNIDTKKLENLMRNYLGRLQPGFIASLRKLSKDRSAAQTLIEGMYHSVNESQRRNARLINYFVKRADMIENFKQIPNYVPHVATEEALDRLAKLHGQDKNFLAKFMSPKTSRDLLRAFQLAGRPLSFEEIETVIKKGEYYATAPGTGKILGIADEAAGPIYKKRNVIERIKGKPKELADFFQTDERLVLETAGYQTARSVSMADYMHGAMRMIDAKPYDMLTEAEKARWRQFGKLNGADSITDQLPHLENLWVRPDMGTQAIRGAQAFMGDVHNHPVVRYYDSFMKWWVSYTLPIFPAFHTRNKIGNLLNMQHAGFLDDFGRDVFDGMQSTRLQWMIHKGNIEDAKRLKFLIKEGGLEIDGLDLHRLALENGVLNDGWFGRFSKTISDQIDPARRNWKRWFPGHVDFAPVHAGREVGRYIENGDRLTLFINRLRKGDTVEEAAAKVKKFLGDYRTEIMTPFERNFMARVFPFYRWSRFNVPLQFEQVLLNHKSRARLLGMYRGQELAQTAISSALGEEEAGITTADLPEWIPSWIRETAGVPVARDPKTGELMFFLMEGWHPAADIDNFLSVRTFTRFVSNSSPFLLSKFFETSTGRSLFLDRDLEMQQSEFLGKIMDAETVNWLRMLRVLAELDRSDPFGWFHRVRTLPPGHERTIRAMSGLYIARTQPEREIVRHNEKYLELLNARLSYASRAKAAKLEREREKK